MAVLEPANLVFFVGFVVYTAIRGVYAGRTKGNVKTVRRVDALERWLLFTVVVSSLLLPVLYLFTPLLEFANYDLPEPLRWLGSAVMLAALWLFWRSHDDLGTNWSPTLEIRQGHEMVKHGVYRRIRHPMYAAIFLFSLAQGLMLENWLAGWVAFVTFSVLYVIRTPREERLMIESFGQEYQDYMRQTGRLFPPLFR
jgi:protein-S-isoprenylcysteine O-methyltransferase Ste14